MINRTNGKAKFYIYRNLNCGNTFSVKYKGIVIDRLDNFTAHDCQLNVSEAGRKRALDTKKRNVHAFVVTDIYQTDSGDDIDSNYELKYNPFKLDSFTCQGKKVHYAKTVLFRDGKAYII